MRLDGEVDVPVDTGPYVGERRRRAAGWFGFDAYDEIAAGYLTPCWIYRKKPTQRGYAQMKMPDGSQPTAHRAFYEHHIGPIPDGLTLDHLCRNRRCVNPAHMEPVTRGENVLRGTGLSAENARKTHCQHGHEFDSENTYVHPNGSRVCRICYRAWRRRRQGRPV